MDVRAKNDCREVNDQSYYFKLSWFQLLRPLTASGTLSPVLVATGFAAMNGDVQVAILLLTLISALCIQLAGNMLNHYYDFKMGQDYDRWVQGTTDDQHGPAFEKVPYISAVILGIAAVSGILPHRAGRQAALLLLLLLLFIPYGVIFSLMLLRVMSMWGFIVLLAFPFCFRLLYCYRQKASREEQMKGMKWAALHHWAFGLLFALSVWLPLAWPM